MSKTTADSGAPLLEVEGLGVRIGSKTLVERVDLTLHERESIAIVGESGSGKSLTSRAILGLLPRGLDAHGSVRLRGRELLGLSERELRRVRGGEIAMILQDPFTMLNPLMKCGIQITEGLELGRGRQGRTRRREEAIRRLAEVGIEDPAVADLYPFQLSGGMRQRVAISAALARDPQVLIADEPSTALDVTTQRAILELIRGIQAARGMALILITHDLRVAFSACQQVSVLYAGAQMELAPSAELHTAPLHPYTLGLMLSEPPLDSELERLPALAGHVPTPDSVVGRCAFADRCEWVTDACRSERPPLRTVAPGRLSACRRIEEIEGELLKQRVEKPALVHHERVAAGDAVLQAVGLKRDFRVGRETICAVRGVDFAVRRGEAVGVVGESGSGKTTLGRCLVGLDTPTEGSVLVEGVDVTNRGALDGKQRLALRHRVQMVFQDPYSSLNPKMTIGDTLKEAIDIAHGTETVAALLEMVGLPATYAERKPVALSGGERQRVAIARSLAVGPEVLVCDEAVSALDVSVQAQVLNLLKDLRERLNLAIVFVSHDLAVVRQIAERVYVMHGGLVVEDGTVRDVLGDPQHPYTRRLIASSPGAPAEADAAAAAARS